MRVVLLILAILCVLLAVCAVGLFVWARQPILLNNTDVYVAQIAAALGFVVGLATGVVGLVAMVSRRHWGWLSGLIIAGLISAGGSCVALFVIQPLQYYVTWDPCWPATSCQLPPPSWLPWSFLAAPIVVGLVTLLYSFQVRAPRVVR